MLPLPSSAVAPSSPCMAPPAIVASGEGWESVVVPGCSMSCMLLTCCGCGAGSLLPRRPAGRPGSMPAGPAGSLALPAPTAGPSSDADSSSPALLTSKTGRRGRPAAAPASLLLGTGGSGMLCARGGVQQPAAWGPSEPACAAYCQRWACLPPPCWAQRCCCAAPAPWPGAAGRSPAGQRRQRPSRLMVRRGAWELLAQLVRMPAVAAAAAVATAAGAAGAGSRPCMCWGACRQYAAAPRERALIWSTCMCRAAGQAVVRQHCSGECML
jgi:hypothetical protein